MAARFALMLDFDKTMTYSARGCHTYYPTWRTVFAECLQFELTDEIWAELRTFVRGSWRDTFGDVLCFLQGEFGVDCVHHRKMRDLAEILQDKFLAFIRKGDVKERPGVRSLLSFAQRSNAPIGICTNALSAFVHEALRILGLHHFVDEIVGCNDVYDYAVRTKSPVELLFKPASYPWKVLARRLNVRGQQVVIVEDRVRNAITAIRCRPSAQAFVLAHWDNREERIPRELRSRVRWIRRLSEVTALLRKKFGDSRRN